MSECKICRTENNKLTGELSPQLEDDLGGNLESFKSFIDKEILVTLGHPVMSDSKGRTVT